FAVPFDAGMGSASIAGLHSTITLDSVVRRRPRPGSGRVRIVARATARPSGAPTTPRAVLSARQVALNEVTIVATDGVGRGARPTHDEDVIHAICAGGSRREAR